MNRIVTFLLGAGFLLIFTDSKGHSHNLLNGKFKKVSPEVTHSNELLIDNTSGSIPMADTTNPGNKNRGTAQDYNSTRSNKANCVIIINVGDSKPTNNKDSSSNNHPSSISTAQDFNTTRSNRQNSAIVINIGNDNPNSNDSTPQKNNAQDFNTTRSNRQNSAIVINVGNDNPNSNDSTPQKNNAQDFNTVRSNRQNSAIVINVGNDNSDNNDSNPQKNNAQDFNTTRSNRQNSNYKHEIIINVSGNRSTGKEPTMIRVRHMDGTEVIDDWSMPIVGNPNNNDSTPGKQEAQDYNSTRSNKVYPNRKNPLYNDKGNSGSNPIFEGTNKNGIRERHYQVAGDVILVIREMDPNKNANQEKDNPLYEGSNTTHQNPLYDGNKMTTNGGGNSTNNPGKQPTRQEAQDYNSSRSNKCSGHLLAGVSNGGGDHTGSGWNIELGNRFSIVNHFFIDISASYTSLNFKYKGSSFLSEEYVQNMQRSIQNNKWNMMTFSAGPVVQLGSGKLNADIYAKPGITFIQSPGQFIGVQDSRGHVTYETGAAIFSGSATAFSVSAGININYAVSKRVDIFLNPNFFSAVGKNISYQEKDASKALLDDKSFDYKTFMTLPYETKQEQLRTLGVSAGFRINFCK